MTRRLQKKSTIAVQSDVPLDAGTLATGMPQTAERERKKNKERVEPFKHSITPPVSNRILIAHSLSLLQVRRVHFNDFMLDVHARLRSASREPDPLGRVAADLVSAAPVLALDELFVTDVADAAILARLFAGLWAGGLVLVSTSNRPPADLYKGGLQRDLFLPFIESLVKHTTPLDLASPVDYRRLAHAARGLYFCPPDWPTPEAGSAELRARFAEVAAAPGCHPLAGGGARDGPAPPPAPAAVPVMMGRTLSVPLASGAAAYFPFSALCGAALGAADYIALARAFHTLALDGVPVFTAATAPAAARFVTLVDVLYEHRVRTFISAAATPASLFANVLSRAGAAAMTATARPGGGGKAASSALPDGAWVDDNLAFAMERTISRLTEMQTLTYLVAHARAHAPVLLLALEEQAARAGSVAERRNV
jgi:peroxisome-assembly ATPase